MNWTHIPSTEFRCNVTILNYNVKNHYQFAISANSRRLLSNGTNSYHQSNCKSSGMVWESCTIQNNISMKIDPWTAYEGPWTALNGLGP